MINELIDQIGGRDGVEDMAEGNWPDSGFYDNIKLMARALLAVLDAKPVAVVDIQRGRGDGKKFALCYTSAGHSLPDDVYNLYTTPPAASVPDGWKLVPIEATPDMLDASWKIHSIYHPSAYRTMVAAAPAPAGDGG